MTILSSNNYDPQFVSSMLKRLAAQINSDKSTSLLVSNNYDRQFVPAMLKRVVDAVNANYSGSIISSKHYDDQFVVEVLQRCVDKVNTGGGGGGGIAPAIHYDGTDGSKFLKCSGVTFPVTSTSTVLCVGWVGNVTSLGGIGFNTSGESTGRQFPMAFYSNGDGTSSIEVNLKNADSPFAHDICDFFDGAVPVDLSIGWHSYAASVDTSTQTMQVMIDRVLLDTSSTSWSSSEQAFLGTGKKWAIDTNNDGDGISSEMSNFFFQVDQSFFDLTVSGNADKLFSPANKAISWGADGSLITGVQPSIFFKGDATNYGNNLGDGGIFLPFNFAYGDGVITNALTSPSD